MKYQNLQQTENYSRADALAALESANERTVVENLLAIVFCDDDRKWVQDLCVEKSKSQTENIRGIAILCFGHLARIHGQIDKELVVPIVRNGLNGPSEFVRGHSQSALDDIQMFVK